MSTVNSESPSGQSSVFMCENSSTGNPPIQQLTCPVKILSGVMLVLLASGTCRYQMPPHVAENRSIFSSNSCHAKVLYVLCALLDLRDRSQNSTLVLPCKTFPRPHVHVKVMGIIKYQQNKCTTVILQFLQHNQLPHHAAGMVPYKPGTAIGSTEGRVSTRKKANIEETAYCPGRP